MKPVTREMIKIWKMKDVDWMGYKLQKRDTFTFHHLIVPAREGGLYSINNGAILCGRTSHPYLHVIERIDYDRFLYITSLLIEINTLGRLDINVIKKIDSCLKYFEKEHINDRTKNKKRVIKPEYLRRDYSRLK